MRTTSETYRAWHQHATQLLRAKPGSDPGEAHSAARLLLDFAVGTRYAHLVAPERSLEPDTLAWLGTALDSAAAGTPLPYILGTIEFFGRPFRSDRRALIPRPETELLIQAVLDRLQARQRPGLLKLADLGTGSGCIAVTLALELAGSQIYATDIEAGARELATANALTYGAQVTVLEGAAASWTAPVAGHAPFDAIVSNPPYIAREALASLAIGVRDFEPRAALDGGEDGLDPYRSLARESGPFLAQDGFLAAELGAGQFEDAARIFLNEGWRVEAPILDLQGHARVLVARFCFT